MARCRQRPLGFSIIAFGCEARAEPEPKGTDGEWKKAILAHAIQGSALIFIDNLHSRVDSDALASAITSGIIGGRVLGLSKQVEGKILGVWVLAANNLKLSAEMQRRCVPIRLDTETPDPTTCRSFRHPDLRAWISENRERLVWACLVLIQNWIAMGQPLWTERSLASFEAYSTKVGGVLAAAGIPGFFAISIC